MAEKTIENITLPEQKVKSKVDSDYNIEVIKDYDRSVDPFILSNKDPEYEYRFLREESKNLKEKTSNLLFQKGGWQLCPREHLVRIGIKPTELSQDGFYRAGDQVLAFMPKKLFLEKEEAKKKKANAPVDAIKRLLKDGDSSVSGIGHENMKGIQTQKDLGM